VLDLVTDRAADARAFANWIRPHWAVLYRVAVRLCGAVDGEDILQDADRGLAERHQFDPARGTAQAWLLAIRSQRRCRSSSVPPCSCGRADPGGRRRFWRRFR
jgi:DNA-directed RNA polymerase specialized sigma24 family protein